MRRSPIERKFWNMSVLSRFLNSLQLISWSQTSGKLIQIRGSVAAKELSPIPLAAHDRRQRNLLSAMDVGWNLFTELGNAYRFSHCYLRTNASSFVHIIFIEFYMYENKMQLIGSSWQLPLSSCVQIILLVVLIIRRKHLKAVCMKCYYFC